ncbi:hypothetical protein [Apibacter adventoris]|nr:hypothetical protein [Apibacter adventoris]
METREYSIDRTSSSRTNYEQVGSIQTTYVKPEQINTNETYKPSNIEYYPFSNIQISYYEYTAPRGTGNKVIEGLNDSRFSKNKLKGGKADYLGIIKEIFKSIKKK